MGIQGGGGGGNWFLETGIQVNCLTIGEISYTQDTNR